MATLKVDLQPQQLDLALYAGDGVKLKFILTQNPGTGEIDVTGAVTAQIKVNRSDTTAVESFTTDLTEHADGIVYLLLTGAQTQGLVDDASAVDGKFSGVWDMQWVPTAGQPRTLVQGKVECVIDVTR